MASGTPEPPAAELPRTRIVAPQDWWRVHSFDSATGRYASTSFNNSPASNARFSPLLDAAGAVVPSIYAASSLEGVLMESVLRDVPFPSTGHQHDFSLDRAGSSPCF